MCEVERHNPETEEASVGIRLTPIDWLVVAGILCVVAFCLPAVWRLYEGFVPDKNYRVPDPLTEDYWHYTRYVNEVAAEPGILLVGDSVVWGRYVRSEETLSTYLHEQTAMKFWNLGLNGLHPLALEGLLRYHAKDLHEKYIVLFYNPLWVSSPKRDLNVTEEFSFNHPRLVPQFQPFIPCYRESMETRAEIVVARYMPLRQIATHLSIAYYQSMTLPRWTIEFPYRCVLRAFDNPFPDPDFGVQEDRRSWIERGISPQSFKWMNPEQSLQWAAFQKAALYLRDKGNAVFIVVAPFNEYIIADDSRPGYERILSTAKQWFIEQEFAYYLFPVMPSELFADASHPTKEGYQYLARELLEQDTFQVFLEQFKAKQMTGTHVASISRRWSSVLGEAEQHAFP